MRERPAAQWLTLFREDGNVAAAPYQTTQQMAYSQPERRNRKYRMTSTTIIPAITMG